MAALDDRARNALQLAAQKIKALTTEKEALEQEVKRLKSDLTAKARDHANEVEQLRSQVQQYRQEVKVLKQTQPTKEAAPVRQIPPTTQSRPEQSGNQKVVPTSGTKVKAAPPAEAHVEPQKKKVNSKSATSSGNKPTKGGWNQWLGSSFSFDGKDSSDSSSDDESLVDGVARTAVVAAIPSTSAKPQRQQKKAAQTSSEQRGRSRTTTTTTTTAKKRTVSGEPPQSKRPRVEAFSIGTSVEVLDSSKALAGTVGEVVGCSVGWLTVRIPGKPSIKVRPSRLRRVSDASSSSTPTLSVAKTTSTAIAGIQLDPLGLAVGADDTSSDDEQVRHATAPAQPSERRSSVEQRPSAQAEAKDTEDESDVEVGPLNGSIAERQSAIERVELKEFKQLEKKCSNQLTLKMQTLNEKHTADGTVGAQRKHLRALHQEELARLKEYFASRRHREALRVVHEQLEAVAVSGGVDPARLRVMVHDVTPMLGSVVLPRFHAYRRPLAPSAPIAWVDELALDLAGWLQYRLCTDLLELSAPDKTGMKAYVGVRVTDAVSEGLRGSATAVRRAVELFLQVVSAILQPSEREPSSMLGASLLLQDSELDGWDRWTTGEAVLESKASGRLHLLVEALLTVFERELYAPIQSPPLSKTTRHWLTEEWRKGLNLPLSRLGTVVALRPSHHSKEKTAEPKESQRSSLAEDPETTETALKLDAAFDTSSDEEDQEKPKESQRSSLAEDPETTETALKLDAAFDTSSDEEDQEKPKESQRSSLAEDPETTETALKLDAAFDTSSDEEDQEKPKESQRSSLAEDPETTETALKLDAAFDTSSDEEDQEKPKESQRSSQAEDPETTETALKLDAAFDTSSDEEDQGMSKPSNADDETSGLFVTANDVDASSSEEEEEESQAGVMVVRDDDVAAVAATLGEEDPRMEAMGMRRLVLLRAYLSLLEGCGGSRGRGGVKLRMLAERLLSMLVLESHQGRVTSLLTLLHTLHTLAPTSPLTAAADDDDDHHWSDAVHWCLAPHHRACLSLGVLTDLSPAAAAAAPSTTGNDRRLVLFQGALAGLLRDVGEDGSPLSGLLAEDTVPPDARAVALLLHDQEVQARACVVIRECLTRLRECTVATAVRPEDVITVFSLVHCDRRGVGAVSQRIGVEITRTMTKAGCLFDSSSGGAILPSALHWASGLALVDPSNHASLELSKLCVTTALKRDGLQSVTPLIPFATRDVFTAHVINLSSRPDRWCELLNQTRGMSHTLVLKRFDAVSSERSHLVSAKEVGSHWDSTINARYDRKCVANRSIPLTPSERCCAASHLALWRQLARQKPGGGGGGGGQRDRWDRMVILEDDVQLSKNFCERLDELWHMLDRLESVGVEWDVVFLGYILPKEMNARRRPKKRKGMQRNGTFIEVVPESVKVSDLDPDTGKSKGKGRHMLFDVEYVWGLHAYILRQSGAKKLIRSAPIDAPADCFVSRLSGEALTLKALGLVKPIANQNRKLGSDISHSGVNRIGVRAIADAVSKGKNPKNKKNS